MTQSRDNQLPLTAASNDAAVEALAPRMSGGTAPASDDRHNGRDKTRVSGGKKASRASRTSPVVVIAPAGSADDRSTPLLRLDLTAVAGATGLGHEVTLLRAAIRRLAGDEDAAPHVKTLAELRHQVEALCTALKTQHALDGRGDDLSADLARALEELGDELGVPR